MRTAPGRLQENSRAPFLSPGAYLDAVQRLSQLRRLNLPNPHAMISNITAPARS